MNNIDIIKDIREIKSNINDINSKMDVVENTSYITESGSKTFTSVDGYADNFIIYGKTEVLTSSGLESEPSSEGANIVNFGGDGLITITSENGSITDKKIVSTILRGLQNGSKDVVKKVNGVYVKTTHLGQVTFDGSDDETWNMVGDNFGSVLRFINKDFPIKTNLEVATICDKLNSYPDNASFGADMEGISNRNNGTGFNVQILKTKLSSNDVTGFRAYLKSNPITVVYELVESVDEFIPDFNPRVFEGTNTIRIDGGYVRNDITFEVTNCFKTSFDVMKEKLSNADLGIDLAFQRGDNVKKMLVDKLISGGANVSTSDTFETLINNMSLGKKWASGVVSSNGDYYTFYGLNGDFIRLQYVKLPPIPFKPIFIIVIIPAYSEDSYISMVLNYDENRKWSAMTCVTSNGSNSIGMFLKTDETIVKNNYLYTIPIAYQYRYDNCIWYAFE